MAANKITTAKDYRRWDRIKVDTCTNTMCAGAIFKKHNATRKVADVSRFHDSLNTMKNIEVVTAITAIDLNGETIIGVFNKFLWFEETMERSLMPLIQL